MKKLAIFLSVITISSCTYDDSVIWQKITEYETRIAKLEELCSHINTNITSLQSVIKALQSNDYITNVSPIIENSEEVGYTLHFYNSGPITIYNGKNGLHGTNGKTPIIGVRLDIDGFYYWTLDSDWLRDDNGNKIKAVGTDGTNGKDGITPTLKVENGYWYVSYDNGLSWVSLWKIDNNDNEDDSRNTIFSALYEKDNYIVIELTNGCVFNISTDVLMSDYKCDTFLLQAGQTTINCSVPFVARAGDTIHYRIKGSHINDTKVAIRLYTKDSYESINDYISWNAEGTYTLTEDCDRFVVIKYNTLVTDDTILSIEIGKGCIDDFISLKDNYIRLYNKPALSFIDDDFSYTTYSERYDTIIEWCIKENIFFDFAYIPVSTDSLNGRADKMRELNLEGFGVLLHPTHDYWYNDPNGLFFYDESIIRKSLLGCIQSFIGNQFRYGNILVYPGNSDNWEGTRKIAKEYVECAIKWNNNLMSNHGVDNSRYRLNRLNIQLAQNNKSAIKEAIKNALMNGDWVILGGHIHEFEVSDLLDETSMTTANLIDILNYANSLSEIRSVESVWRERKPMFDYYGM